ncbi:MAG: glycosyltransferase family 39 protein [candidate division Zixibacteria bacterium]|nr:glycosyltransferase family 39 protein [candidate division Zixibacteria bacterium]
MNKKIWVLVFGLFTVRFVLALLLPLSPQEAYYWNYSRHPALSYFDHPPLVAWSIALSTFAFGDSVFGIRLPALLYSFGTFLALHLFVRKLFGSRLEEFLPLLLSPFFFIGGSQMLPDSPLLFFFSLVLFAGHQAAIEGDEKAWYGFGAATGLALLSKYTAVIIFAGLGTYVLLTRSWHFLCSRNFWFSILLCALIFSPVVIWNTQNGWASFLFQSTRRAGELSGFHFNDFGRYLITQIITVSPILWLVNWRALWVGFREGLKGSNRSFLFLTSFALPFFSIFTLLSFFYWVKLNWLWPGYLCATALAILLASHQKLRLWFKTSLVSSAAVTVLSTFLLFYQPFAVNWSGNSLAGWKELAEKVERMKGSRMGEWLVAGYEYKAASGLAFYLSGQPETYSNTLVGRPGLQYDFWFKEREVLGKNFIFVIDRRYQLKNASAVLANFFSQVEPPDSLVAKSGRGYVTTFYIYPCYQYKGR